MLNVFFLYKLYVHVLYEFNVSFNHHENMSMLCIPHFYIAKLGYAGVYLFFFFLIFAPKHRLWVLVRTASF